MSWPLNLFFFGLGFFTAYLILILAIFVGKFIKAGKGMKKRNLHPQESEYS